MSPNESLLTTLMGEDEVCSAPNPFPERGAADTLTALRFSPDVTLTTMANTIQLDQQQQQIVAQEESAKRRSETTA